MATTAQKKIGWAKESFRYWFEDYIDALRMDAPTADTKMDFLGGKTARQDKEETAIEGMKAASERMAKFEALIR